MSKEGEEGIEEKVGEVSLSAQTHSLRDGSLLVASYDKQRRLWLYSYSSSIRMESERAQPPRALEAVHCGQNLCCVGCAMLRRISAN